MVCLLSINDISTILVVYYDFGIRRGPIIPKLPISRIMAIAYKIAKQFYDWSKLSK